MCRPLQAADLHSPCSRGVLRPTTASLVWRALCASASTEILSILQGADKMLLSLGRRIMADFSVRMSLLPHHSCKTFSCTSKIQNCLFHPSKFSFFRVTNAAINCISFVKIGKYFRVVKKEKKRGVLILLETGQHTGYFSVKGENAVLERDGKQTEIKRGRKEEIREERSWEKKNAEQINHYRHKS